MVVLSALALGGATTPFGKALLRRGHLCHLELEVENEVGERRCHARQFRSDHAHTLAALGKGWCLGHRLEGEGC